MGGTQDDWRRGEKVDGYGSGADQQGDGGRLGERSTSRPYEMRSSKNGVGDIDCSNMRTGWGCQFQVSGEGLGRQSNLIGHGIPPGGGTAHTHTRDGDCKILERRGATIAHTNAGLCAVPQDTFM